MFGFEPQGHKGRPVPGSALANVAVTRIAATLQRLDLPGSLLGLPTPPPGPADVKVLRSGSGWTMAVSCSLRHADAFTAWLHSLGAADVQHGPGPDPALRARFHQLPPTFHELLDECRLEHVGVSADGTASIVVRGSDDAVARLAQGLGGGRGRDDEPPAPPLTPRQAELLQYCVMRGYYSIPRRASLRRLSGELGISTTSLSIALRRAEGKIILAHAARMRRAGVLPAPRAPRAGGPSPAAPPAPAPTEPAAGLPEAPPAAPSEPMAATLTTRPSSPGG
jgi:hypothetical protein